MRVSEQILSGNKDTATRALCFFLCAEVEIVQRRWEARFVASV